MIIKKKEKDKEVVRIVNEIKTDIKTPRKNKWEIENELVSQNKLLVYDIWTLDILSEV